MAFQRTSAVVLTRSGTSIGPPGSGGTAPSSSSLLLAMNSIGSSSLLESGAVALRKMATLFLLRDTSARVLVKWFAGFPPMTPEEQVFLDKRMCIE